MRSAMPRTACASGLRITGRRSARIDGGLTGRRARRPPGPTRMTRDVIWQLSYADQAPDRRPADCACSALPATRSSGTIRHQFRVKFLGGICGGRLRLTFAVRPALWVTPHPPNLRPAGLPESYATTRWKKRFLRRSNRIFRALPTLARCLWRTVYETGKLPPTRSRPRPH